MEKLAEWKQKTRRNRSSVAIADRKHQTAAARCFTRNVSLPFKHPTKILRMHRRPE
jgi:hypothetical protein